MRTAAGTSRPYTPTLRRRRRGWAAATSSCCSAGAEAAMGNSCLVARPGRPASAGPVVPGSGGRPIEDRRTVIVEREIGRRSSGRSRSRPAAPGGGTRPAGAGSVQRALEELVRRSGALLDVRTGGELLEEVLQDAVALDVGPLLGRRRELGVERGGDSGLGVHVVTHRGGVLRVARDETVLAQLVLELLREDDLQEALGQLRVLGLRRDGDVRAAREAVRVRTGVETRQREDTGVLLVALLLLGEQRLGRVRLVVGRDALVAGGQVDAPPRPRRRGEHGRLARVERDPRLVGVAVGRSVRGVLEEVLDLLESLDRLR